MNVRMYQQMNEQKIVFNYHSPVWPCWKNWSRKEAQLTKIARRLFDVVKRLDFVLLLLFLKHLQ